MHILMYIFFIIITMILAYFHFMLGIMVNEIISEQTYEVLVQELVDIEPILSSKIPNDKNVPTEPLTRKEIYNKAVARYTMKLDWLLVICYYYPISVIKSYIYSIKIILVDYFCILTLEIYFAMEEKIILIKRLVPLHDPKFLFLLLVFWLQEVKVTIWIMWVRRVNPKLPPNQPDDVTWINILMLLIGALIIVASLITILT